jgi:hypothetical protein
MIDIVRSRICALVVWMDQRLHRENQLHDPNSTIFKSFDPRVSGIDRQYETIFSRRFPYECKAW